MANVRSFDGALLGGGINDLKLIEYNSIRNAKNALTSYYGRIAAYKKAVHKQGGFYFYLDHY